MKTKILFSYTQEIVPPRCRKSRPVRFSDGVFEGEIPEVTGAEAPVAIRSHGQFVFDEGKTFSVDYRWYKGTRIQARSATRLNDCIKTS